MPRKQRFKPSRKPKPIPVEQPQGVAEHDRTSVHLEEGARAPEQARPDPGMDARTHRQEEVEAR